MRIGIDIRCLLEPHPSGVAYYTKNLLEHLFKIDSKNQYFLFYNSYQKNNTKLIKEFSVFSNVVLKKFNYPNKLFNFSINFFNRPQIDKLIGDIDIFFAPNLQFVSLSESCKKIITIHDLSFDLYPEFLSLKRKLWHKFINPKKFINQADKIIAVSKNTKNDLIEKYNIEENKITTIYSGVDNTDNIKTKHTSLLQDISQKYILTISTLEPRKNIESLIDAFNILTQQKKFKDYKLLIAGPSGWKAKRIYQKAKQNKNIKFLGFVSDFEKQELYKNAEAFVYPSFYEGFGFPPLEALNYGTPVIVSMNSSLPEILDQAALYINPYDINEIAQALQSILTDHQLKDSLINLGKKQIQKFNWQTTAAKTLKIFEEEKLYRRIS